MMDVINILTEFTPEADPKVSSPTPFSHIVMRGKLKGTDKIWICKEISDPGKAKLEALAQEFFRLIIPHQPETRLARNPATGVHYILSEEVAGYKSLPKNEAHHFANGTITGLGQALLLAVFLEESDLKNGNIGLNNSNQVIKIDGDRCFSQLRRSEDFNLTHATIDALPYPTGFYANHWLDLITKGRKHKKSSIVSPELAQSEQFRAEVNQAILKICLLPDEFIKSFVDVYIPAGGDRFITLLKDRGELLRSSALVNPSFVDYIGTELAHTEAMSFLNHMKKFKAAGAKTIVVDEAHKNIEQDVLKKMQNLHFLTEESRTITEENRSLIAQLRLVKVGDYEPHLTGFLKKKENELINSNYDPAQLSLIRCELQKQISFVTYSLSIYRELVGYLNEIDTCRIQGYDDGLFDYMVATEKRINENKNSPERLADMAKDLEQQVQLCKKAKPLLKENIELLGRLPSHMINKEDKLLSNYVKETEINIRSNANNPEKLLAINRNIKAVIESVKSPQVQEVRAVVRSLRANIRMYNTSKESKADKIERALLGTPLLKRGTVISQKGKANAVQEEIAAHRLRGKTYKTKDGRIDLARAPQTYQAMVKKYDGVVHVKPRDLGKKTDQDASSQAKP